jgi:pimeloyl-ACP methyl ester carboxylesterase
MRLSRGIVAAVSTALALWLGGHEALAQKSGGVVKMPDFANPASRSIHEEVTRAAVTVLMPVLNNLVLFDQHKERNTIDTIVPDLAESWIWSEAGKELTFKLRNGVKWHDGKPFTGADVKCTWDLLQGKAPKLRKAGHEVYAPTLIGIGERKHLLNREIDLDTHIQDVIGVLDDEDLSEIGLVGHSYGGMVISGVADRVPEKVASLVYLDAFVPENGQSLFSVLPPDRRLVAVPGEDWLVAPIPSAGCIGAIKARVSGERLAQENPGGAVGRADDFAKPAVIVPLVEARCLKGDCIDKSGGTSTPPSLGFGEGYDAPAVPRAAKPLRQKEQVEKEQSIGGMPEETAQDLAAAVVANEDVQGRIVARAKLGSIVGRQPAADHRLRLWLAGFG